MARSLMDNIEEYTARNMKEFQNRQKQQQEDKEAAAAALDEKDELPPRTAAELEEEQHLISALKTESSEPTEDPFTSEDIIDNPDATPGKNLEKALDSLILITKNAESDDNDVTPDDTDPLALQQQQKSLSFDLLSDNSGNSNAGPLIELTPSHSDPVRTDNPASDSPTLPDLLGKSPPKNQPVLEPSEGSSDASQQNTELNTTPDLMLEDNLATTKMPLDIASNVRYPPLDLLSNEEVSSQLVDITQGVPKGELLLANEVAMDPVNTNPTPGKLV